MHPNVQDLLHGILSQGLPVVAAASGSVLGAMRSNKLGSVMLYSGAGWLSGYVVQKVLFRLMEGGAKHLPEPSGKPMLTALPGGKEVPAPPQGSPSPPPPLSSAPPPPPSGSGGESPGSSGNMSGAFGGE
jgi:hypothetical protein